MAALDAEKAALVGGCMFRALVATDKAQSRRHKHELDRWQAVLDSDPRLRLPTAMSQALCRREKIRKAEAEGARIESEKQSSDFLSVAPIDAARTWSRGVIWSHRVGMWR